jgi:hypothetical protein
MAVLEDVPAASWKVVLAFLVGKVKNGVGCAHVGENREGLGMVGNKGGIRLNKGENREAHWASCKRKLRTLGWVPPRDSKASGSNLVPGG